MSGIGEDDAKCPVCAETYTREGNQVLTRLSCEHTVCSACFQGELVKKHRVDCPLCAETHQFSNEFVNEITEQDQQNYEHEQDDLCEKHWWKSTLFCMEPGCQIPVCVQCVKEEHKNHDFGNLEEVMDEKCEALLADVELLKKTLQNNRHKLIIVQNKESSNISTCIENIRKKEAELIGKINKMTEKMVQKVLDQKTQLENNLNEATARLQDNFILLESIKDTITYSGSTSHKSFRDKLKAVKKSGEQVRTSLMGVQKYKHVAFQEEKISKRKVKTLFGQLKMTQKTIPFFRIKSVNRNVMKQQLLSKSLTNRHQIGLRGANEESDVEIVEAPKSKPEVIEVSDDEDHSDKGIVKHEETQRREAKVVGSSGGKRKSKDQNNKTPAEANNSGSSLKQLEKHHHSTVRIHSKRKSAVTADFGASVARKRRTQEDDPPWPKWWETADLQCQCPSVKRRRPEQTRKEIARADQGRNCQSTIRNATFFQSSKLKFRNKGNLLLSFYFCVNCHRWIFQTSLINRKQKLRLITNELKLFKLHLTCWD